jgi:uncharacterized protein (TIGR00106 family)
MTASRKVTVMADFSIIPIGHGNTSVGKYVGEAVKAISKIKGIRYEITAMGTILEAERLDTILEAVKHAHEAVSKLSVQRIESTLRIDDRRDKPRTLEDKIQTVKSHIQR